MDKIKTQELLVAVLGLVGLAAVVAYEYYQYRKAQQPVTTTTETPTQQQLLAQQGASTQLAQQQTQNQLAAILDPVTVTSVYDGTNPNNPGYHIFAIGFKLSNGPGLVLPQGSPPRTGWPKTLSIFQHGYSFAIDLLLSDGTHQQFNSGSDSQGFLSGFPVDGVDSYAFGWTYNPAAYRGTVVSGTLTVTDPSGTSTTVDWTVPEGGGTPPPAFASAK